MSKWHKKVNRKRRRIMINRLLARDGLNCAICGEFLDRSIQAIGHGVTHPMQITIDHIIPIAKSMDNSFANKRAVHYKCNHAKGDLLDEELECVNFGLVKDSSTAWVIKSPTAQ